MTEDRQWPENQDVSAVADDSGSRGGMNHKGGRGSWEHPQYG